MEFRLLQYFVAAAELGSFTAAAGSLHVSQPSLSEGIRRLEIVVSAPLFHRVGRGVVLTEAGHALIPRARHILNEVEEAREEMVALRGLHGGRVRVAAPPGLTVDPLTRFIATFHRLHPEVVISVLPAEDGGVAIDAVQSALCEIALVDRPATSPDIEAHVIAHNQIMIAAPPGTEVDADASVALESLAGRAFISSFPGTRTRAVLDQARELGVDVRVVVETPHREAVVPLVLEGVGSAFLTESVAREAARHGAVVRPLEPAFTYDIHLVHRAKPMTRAATTFVQHTLRDARSSTGTAG